MQKITIKNNIIISFDSISSGSRSALLGKGPTPRQGPINELQTIITDIVKLRTPWKKIKDHSEQQYTHHLTIQPSPKIKTYDVYDYDTMEKSFIKFIQQNNLLFNSCAGAMELGKNLKPHLHIIFSANNKNAIQLRTNAKKLYATNHNAVTVVLRPAIDVPEKLPCHVVWCGEPSDQLPSDKYKTGYPYLQKEPENRKTCLLYKKYYRNLKKIVRKTNKQKAEAYAELHKEYEV